MNACHKALLDAWTVLSFSFEKLTLFAWLCEIWKMLSSVFKGKFLSNSQDEWVVNCTIQSCMSVVWLVQWIYHRSLWWVVHGKFVHCIQLDEKSYMNFVQDVKYVIASWGWKFKLLKIQSKKCFIRNSETEIQWTSQRFLKTIICLMSYWFSSQNLRYLKLLKSAQH